MYSIELVRKSQRKRTKSYVSTNSHLQGKDGNILALGIVTNVVHHENVRR